jgi:hypothetical protein
MPKNFIGIDTMGEVNQRSNKPLFFLNEFRYTTMENKYVPPKELTHTALLIEKYGIEYLNLMSRDKAQHETRIRNHKAEIITRIMAIRKELEWDLGTQRFDELYDLPLHDLMNKETEYLDAQYLNQHK